MKTPFDVCEKDPLQFCGAIQGFAGLMVIDPVTSEITFISENFEGIWEDHGICSEGLRQGHHRFALIPEYRFFERWVEPRVLECIRNVPLGQSRLFPKLLANYSIKIPMELRLEVGRGIDRLQKKESRETEAPNSNGGSPKIFDILVHHIALDDRAGAPHEGAKKTAFLLEWFDHIPIKPSIRQSWSLYRGLNEAQSMDYLLENIHKIIPYERGMVYQFESDGSGTVVAEKLVEPVYPPEPDLTGHKGSSFEKIDQQKNQDLKSQKSLEKPLQSYLGLRYPATDIPRIVRELYLKNSMRHIADAQAPVVAVLGLKNPIDDASSNGSGQVESKPGNPLDLSLCVSRGVSPFHVRYMANMGVPSSASFAIVFQNKLWGLVSLHRLETKMIPYLLLERVRELVAIFTNHLRSCEIVYKMSFFDQRSLELDDWIKNLASNSCEEEKVLASPIVGYFGCQEFAFFDGLQWKKFGSTVSDQKLSDFCQKLKRKTDQGFLDTDCLSIEFPEIADLFSAEDYAGFSLMWCTDQSHRMDYFLIFLKKELKKLVTWGSQTFFSEKLGSSSEHVDFSKVSPIHSFGRWQRIVDHHSEPWSRESRFLGRSLVATMIRCLP